MANRYVRSTMLFKNNNLQLSWNSFFFSSPPKNTTQVLYSWYEVFIIIIIIFFFFVSSYLYVKKKFVYSSRFGKFRNRFRRPQSELVKAKWQRVVLKYNEGGNLLFFLHIHFLYFVIMFTVSFLFFFIILSVST